MSPIRSEYPVQIAQIAEEDGHVTVRFPVGTTLSEANAEEFAHELFALAESRPCPHLLIDLGGVAMLTSAILAKLIALNGKVRAAGGRLALSNPAPTVHEVFKVTRLDTILEVGAPVPA
ncbi:MAG: STAS domain-containing protein [Planctomycetes bacterium]|nr:STAS domain-containing protein [Planctomycetota bacterium]